MNAQTGTVEFDNLVIVQGPTALRTLTSGETAKAGQMLKLGSDTKLVAMDEYDTATDVWGIAAAPATAEGSDGSVYVFAAGTVLSAAAVAEATGIASVSEAARNVLFNKGVVLQDTLSLS